MKLTLSENIRTLRRQRKMTQEKLAEVLGVTVGAVYKWEAGLSQPELDLLVEMADFFDTSVDALLGYKLQDKRLDATLERISGYCRSLDPAALTEAEKVLARYPNSFKAVYCCAEVWLVFGASGLDKKQLMRALELLEQAKILLPQNDEPRINETVISGRISTAWFLLGEQDKSLELLKAHNAAGVFSRQIGVSLAIFMNRPKEAEPYLSEALIYAANDLLDTVTAYVFVFRSRGDWAQALDITRWAVGFLAGLKAEEKPGILEKSHAEMLALLASAQAKTGSPEESQASLKKAAEMALRFDSQPDYSLKTMRFAEQTEQALVFDSLGATACGSVSRLFELLEDEAMLSQWKEMTDHAK